MKKTYFILWPFVNKRSKKRKQNFFCWLACLLPFFLTAQSETTSNPYRFGVWGGLAYNWLLDDGYFAPVFGAEMRIKNTQQYIMLFAAPVSHYNEHFHANIRNTGINCEVGLAYQHFQVGPISGRVSKVYLGFDARFGRRSFDYGQNGAGFRQKSNWTKLMARFGLRFNAGRFFTDLALPLGIQIRRSTFENGSSNTEEKDFRYVVLPALALGCHF